MCDFYHTTCHILHKSRCRFVGVLGGGIGVYLHIESIFSQGVFWSGAGRSSELIPAGALILWPENHYRKIFFGYLILYPGMGGRFPAISAAICHMAAISAGFAGYIW